MQGEKDFSKNRKPNLSKQVFLFISKEIRRQIIEKERRLNIGNQGRTQGQTNYKEYPNQNRRFQQERISQSAIVETKDLDESTNDPSYRQNSSFRTISNQQRNGYMLEQNDDSIFDDRPSQTGMQFKQNISNEKLQEREKYQPLILPDRFDQSDIISQSDCLTTEVQSLAKKFSRQFKYLGLDPSNKSLLNRANKVYQVLKNRQNIFKEQKDNGMFIMVLQPNEDLILDDDFFRNLQITDLFLMYRIEIGTQVKFKDLVKLFKSIMQSLKQLAIKRQWDLKNQDFKQHGFEFLQNLENQRGLVSIEWKSDKLTQLFVDSFKGSYLVSLKQLKLDFSEKVVDGEAYGKLLGQLFVNINKNNDKFEPINKFNLILDSYVQKREDLGRDVKKYQTRLDVRSKVQKKQQPQNQPQQSNNQPPPPVSQQQSSHQMNQQPISQPVQQLSQQMQQLSISQQPSSQINSQQLPAQQQLPPQSFPQQQSPYQSQPVPLQYYQNPQQIYYPTTSQNLRYASEIYQNINQLFQQSQPFQLPPGTRNISHLSFSPMFGAKVENLDFSEKRNDFSNPNNSNNLNNLNNPNNPNK